MYSLSLIVGPSISLYFIFNFIFSYRNNNETKIWRFLEWWLSSLLTLNGAYVWVRKAEILQTAMLPQVCISNNLSNYAQTCTCALNTAPCIWKWNLTSLTSTQPGWLSLLVLCLMWSHLCYLSWVIVSPLSNSMWSLNLGGCRIPCRSPNHWRKAMPKLSPWEISLC